MSEFFANLIPDFMIWTASMVVLLQHAADWLTAGLTYSVGDGNALAFTRFLTVFGAGMALRASGRQHWTLKAGLGVMMFFLGIDALLGLAPGRVQFLSLAILGRNAGLLLISYGLAVYPLHKPAVSRSARVPYGAK